MIIDFYDSERSSFSGEWQKDVNVRGLIIHRDGNKYDGQLFNDKRHGKGVYTFVDGEVY